MRHRRGGEDAGRRAGRERVVQKAAHDRGGVPAAAIHGQGRYVTQVRVISQEHHSTELRPNDAGAPPSNIQRCRMAGAAAWPLLVGC